MIISPYPPHPDTGLTPEYPFSAAGARFASLEEATRAAEESVQRNAVSVQITQLVRTVRLAPVATVIEDALTLPKWKQSV